MAYIGNQPALAYTSFSKQDFTTSATDTYTLDFPVTNENEIALFLNFVRQEPTTAYTASGTTLTLASAITGSDDMYCVFLGKAVQTVNPPNGSVGLSQLSATGTKDATTFLRGDNTFAEVSTKVKKVSFQSNSTRTSLSASTTKTTILSGTYTNVVASSKVLIHAKMPMHDCSAGAVSVGFTWNGTDYDGGFTYVYESTGNQTIAIMIKSFDAPASTGSINWVIYFKPDNGVNSLPAVIINPNTTDDARAAQQETQISFMEYEI